VKSAHHRVDGFVAQLAGSIDYPDHAWVSTYGDHDASRRGVDQQALLWWRTRQWTGGGDGRSYPDRNGNGYDGCACGSDTRTHAGRK